MDLAVEVCRCGYCPVHLLALCEPCCVTVVTSLAQTVEGAIKKHDT